MGCWKIFPLWWWWRHWICLWQLWRDLLLCMLIAVLFYFFCFCVRFDWILCKIFSGIAHLLIVARKFFQSLSPANSSLPHPHSPAPSRLKSSSSWFLKHCFYTTGLRALQWIYPLLSCIFLKWLQFTLLYICISPCAQMLMT